MPEQDNLSKLYQAFSQKYDNFDNEDQFRAYIAGADDEKKSKLFKAFSDVYDNFDTQEQFDDYVGWNKQNVPSAPSVPEAPVEPVDIPTRMGQFSSQIEGVRGGLGAVPSYAAPMPTAMGAMTGTSMQQQGGKPMFAWTKDEKNDLASNYFLDRADFILKNLSDNLEGDGKTTVGNFLAGVGESLQDRQNLKWTGQYRTIQKQTNKAVEKFMHGIDLTDSEANLLYALALEQSVNDELGGELSRATEVGEMVGASLPFMARQAILASVSAGMGSGLSAAGVTGTAAKMFTSGGQGITEAINAVSKAKKAGQAINATREIALGTARDFAFQGLVTASEGVGIAGDAYDRARGETKYTVDKDGKVTFSGVTGVTDPEFRDHYDAIASEMIENFSESIGQYFAPLGKMAKGAMGKTSLLKGVADAMDKLAANEGYMAASNWLRSAGLNGIIGENLEEYVGGVMNAVLVGDQTVADTFSKQNMEDIFLTTVLLCGAGSAVQLSSAGVNRANARRNLSKIALEGEHLMPTTNETIQNGSVYWEDVQNTLDQYATKPEEMLKYLESLRNDTRVSESQYAAAFEYASNLMYLKGTVDALEDMKEGDPVRYEMSRHADDGLYFTDEQYWEAKEDLETLGGEIDPAFTQMTTDELADYLNTEQGATDEKVREYANKRVEVESFREGLMNQTYKMNAQLAKEAEGLAHRTVGPDGRPVIYIAEFGDGSTGFIVDGRVDMRSEAADGAVVRNEKGEVEWKFNPEGSDDVLVIQKLNDEGFAEAPSAASRTDIRNVSMMDIDDFITMRQEEADQRVLEQTRGLDNGISTRKAKEMAGAMVGQKFFINTEAGPTEVKVESIDDNGQVILSGSRKDLGGTGSLTMGVKEFLGMQKVASDQVAPAKTETVTPSSIEDTIQQMVDSGNGVPVMLNGVRVMAQTNLIPNADGNIEFVYDDNGNLRSAVLPQEEFMRSAEEEISAMQQESVAPVTEEAQTEEAPVSEESQPESQPEVAAFGVAMTESEPSYPILKEVEDLFNGDKASSVEAIDATINDLRGELAKAEAIAATKPILSDKKQVTAFRKAKEDIGVLTSQIQAYEDAANILRSLMTQESGVETTTEVAPETETATETEVAPEAEVAPETETAPEAETTPEAETEVKQEEAPVEEAPVETKPETEPEVNSETKVEEAPVEAVAETETKTKTKEQIEDKPRTDFFSDPEVQASVDAVVAQEKESIRRNKEAGNIDASIPDSVAMTGLATHLRGLTEKGKASAQTMKEIMDYVEYMDGANSEVGALAHDIATSYNADKATRDRAIAYRKKFYKDTKAMYAQSQKEINAAQRLEEKARAKAEAEVKAKEQAEAKAKEQTEVKEEPKEEVKEEVKEDVLPGEESADAAQQEVIRSADDAVFRNGGSLNVTRRSIKRYKSELAFMEGAVEDVQASLRSINRKLKDKKTPEENKPELLRKKAKREDLLVERQKQADHLKNVIDFLESKEAESRYADKDKFNRMMNERQMAETPVEEKPAEKPIEKPVESPVEEKPTDSVTPSNVVTYEDSKGMDATGKISKSDLERQIPYGTKLESAKIKRVMMKTFTDGSVIYLGAVEYKYKDAEGVEHTVEKPYNFKENPLESKIQPMMSRPVVGGDSYGWRLVDHFRSMGMRVITDKAAIAEALGTDDIVKGSELKTTNTTQFLKTAQGEVYGFVKDGTMYLDPDLMNAETPVHEFTHLWDEMYKNDHQDKWNDFKELLKKTDEWKAVMDDDAYADIRDNDDLVASEVHSRLTGRLGAEKAVEINSQLGGRSLWQKISDFIQDVADYVKGFFGGHLDDVRLDKFLQMPIRDLVDGINPTSPDGTTFDNGHLQLQTAGPNPVQNAQVVAQNERINSRAFAFREQFQDVQHSVRVTMDVIQEATGNIPVEDHENYLQRENQSSSIGQVQEELFTRDYYAPMLSSVIDLRNAVREHEGLASNKDGNIEAYEKVKVYMMAKHGIERNELMNLRHHDEALAKGKKYEFSDQAGLAALLGFEGDYTDLMDAAKQYVAHFEATYGKQTINDLWSNVRRATTWSLDHAYRSGILSRSQRDAIRDMYSHYVPLRGFEEGSIAEDVYQYVSSNANRFSSVKQTTKGRTSIADDPIANIMHMAQTEISQGNKNLVKQALFNYVLNRPNNILSIAQTWEAYNPKTDSWEVVAYPNTSGMSEEQAKKAIEDFESDMRRRRENGEKVKVHTRGADVGMRVVTDKDMLQHQILVRVNGEMKTILVHGNPRVAQAVNGLLTGSKGEFISKFNRTIQPMMTNYNLDFLVKNWWRDRRYSFARIRNLEGGLFSGNPYLSRYFSARLRNNIFTMSHLMRGFNDGKITTNSTNAKERAFSEFMELGGQTGYTQINAVVEHRQSLKRMMERLRDGASVNVNNIHNVRNPYGKAMHVLFGWVEHLNECVELMTRFSVYETSLRSGKSKAKAIADAKDISVNFNRRGAQNKEDGLFGIAASWLGKTSYFFNAGVQGFANVAEQAVGTADTAQERRAQRVRFTKTTARLALFGAAVPYINEFIQSMLNPDGDPDEYWNLPEFVRRSNIVIGGDGVYLTFPMGPEERCIYTMGEIAYQAISGRYADKGRFGFMNVAGDMASQMLGLLPVNPIESGTNTEQVAYNFIPDQLKPLASIYANKKFTGAPIWKEGYSKDVPGYEKAYASTPKRLVKICEDMYNFGSGHGEGLNPALIHYLVDSYFSGPSKLLWSSEEALENAVDVIVKGEPLGDVAEDMAKGREIPIFRSIVNLLDDKNETAFVDECFRTYESLTNNVWNKIRSVYNLSAEDKQKVFSPKGVESGRYAGYEGYELAAEFYQQQKYINSLAGRVKKHPDNEELKVELNKAKHELVYHLLDIEGGNNE